MPRWAAGWLTHCRTRGQCTRRPGHPLFTPISEMSAARDTFEGFETRAVHAGEPQPRFAGAVSLPIFQSAMFEYAGEAGYKGLRYIRLSNTPNHEVLHRKLASLERGEDALVTSSGMAAISAALLGMLSCGDHLLVQDCLYGGTRDFITHDFPSFGLSYDFIDPTCRATWEAKVNPNTKAIYVEVLSNPLLQMGDLEGIVSFAKAHRIVAIIDNTFASPVNFRPAEWGFDLSIHSGTKYLNGHSDIVAGACIGRKEIVSKAATKLERLGGALDPHAASLLHRGLKTLAIRVRQQNASALELAEFLRRHSSVRSVYYPGLDTHPGHDRARKLLDGFGGVVSFELHDGHAGAARFIDRVTLPIVAPSLGGVETLVTRPAAITHALLSPEERRDLGISDGLIRVSVGIESIGDILQDFAHALSD